MKMTRAKSKLQDMFGAWFQAEYVYDDGGVGLPATKAMCRISLPGRLRS